MKTILKTAAIALVAVAAVNMIGGAPARFLNGEAL